MNESLPFILWRQFGGALEMLENALLACPEDFWGDKPTWGACIWPITFCFGRTTTFQSCPRQSSSLPHPLTKDEFDPEGVLPERTKAELLNYLAYVREKSRHFVSGLTPERAWEHFADEYRDFSLLELTLYTTRHVQHHTAQLNLLLRQQTDDAPKWVAWSKEGLEG